MADEKETLILQFSGYETDGDHILLIRDLENGAVTKDVKINRGHQFEACNLTVEQIMKIYGYLDSTQQDGAFISKKKPDSYHFSPDDNLVVHSNKGSVALSSLPKYENDNLQRLLTEKFGESEKSYQEQDAQLKNRNIFTKLHDKIKKKNDSMKRSTIGMVSGLLYSALTDKVRK